MREWRIYLVCGLLALASHACSHSEPAQITHYPTVILSSGSNAAIHVRVEVARSESERMRGLMYRDHLAPDSGMLFLFASEQPLTFWMRNTYIPLDMLFIDAQHRVAGVVENAEPLTDEPRRIDKNAQFVLEVPGGWAAAHRITPGTYVQFVDID